MDLRDRVLQTRLGARKNTTEEAQEFGLSVVELIAIDEGAAKEDKDALAIWAASNAEWLQSLNPYEQQRVLKSHYRLLKRMNRN